MKFKKTSLLMVLFLVFQIIQGGNIVMATAYFPNSIVPWTDKTDGINDANAADMNQAYAEIRATETATQESASQLNTQKSRIDSLVQTASTSYYEKCTNSDTGALLIVSSGATTGQINLASVTPVSTGYTAIAGDYVRLVYGVASGSAELMDLRIGADGIVDTSAGASVRRQFNDLIGDIYKAELSYTPVIYDTPKTQTGKCYVNEWGVDNSGYNIYFYPVEAGKKYKVTGTTYGTAKTVVLKKTEANDGITLVVNSSETTDSNRAINLEFIVGTGYAYVALSIPPSELSTFSVSEVARIPKINRFEDIFNDNLIIVDKTGCGDFTSIRDAVLYLTNKYSASELHNVKRTIFVRNGIYTENPTSTEPYAAIPKGANKISIIGESRDGVVINCNISSTACGRCIEAGGDSVIANLTINMLNDGTLTADTYPSSSNPRPYCIHNDADPYDYGYDRIYYTTVKNCKLYSEGMNPVGAGLHHNQIQRYENVECIFNSNWSNGNGAMYIHGPSSTSATAKGVEIDNCTLISKNGAMALALPNVADRQQYTDIHVSIRRTIGVTNGATVTDVSKSIHAITTDSTLNNVSAWNY